MSDSVAELMQRAMAAHQRGALEEARLGYEQVLAREPGHGDALHLCGVVAHQQERHAEAVALISRAIEKGSAQAAPRNNLGLALAALGRSDEAEAAYREALGLEPDFADALLNLGNLLAARGCFDEAAALLERAAHRDARSPQVHYALGCARFALGRSRDALASLARAVTLGADFAEAHYRLGSVHASLGETREAIAAYARALDRDSDHLGAQHGLLECLDGLDEDVEPALLEAIIAPLLRGRSINPRAFGHAAARLLEHKHGLAARAPAAGGAQPAWRSVLDDALVRRYLQRTVNVSAPLEQLLTQCRAHWLDEQLRGASLEAHWERIAAVAIQCFLNEFVWSLTPQEQRGVDTLEQRVLDACASGLAPRGPLIGDLLVLACYRPLWRMACAAQLRAPGSGDWPAPFAEMLRTVLHEPLWEQEAKTRIESGIAIRDGVSRAVQRQYEEHPYPRWQALTRAGRERIEQRVQRWNPGYVAPAALGGPLRVLVAGCGTGRDAIDMALHTENAQVTAIDLSRASLAYAMRKAAEYGLQNIHFRQEDILGFDAPAAAYQVINCTGVLHHMQDPAAGLHRLARMLMPEGLMRLALYSRLARAPLEAVREAIRARGYGVVESDIRTFRQRVLDEGSQGVFGELMGSTDFFSASDCRDLLFHVQETALTLPDVAALLAGAELEFLGFELTIAQVEQGFRREHPQAALTDLEAWWAYEQRHPQSFRGMYQFWCRKIP